jgi:hypothetical protein
MFICYFAVTDPRGIWAGDIPEFITGIILTWAIISLIIALLALLGGIYALLRNLWGLALAGSIAAILIFFPLGIPSVVLVAQARDEFEQAQ